MPVILSSPPRSSLSRPLTHMRAMSTLSPAFLCPAPLHARRHEPLLHAHGSTSPSTCTPNLRPSIINTPSRVAARRRTLCVSQQEQSQSSSPSTPPPDDAANTAVPSASSSSISPPTPAQEADRKERIRQARMGAEKLELMAAKARLEAERAQLHVERKRLEVEKMRSIREIEKSRNGASPVSGPQSRIQNPYDKDSEPDKSIKATVKIGTNPPKQVSAGSLSELLGAEFPRVSESDIDIIKDKVCGMDSFFVTEVERSPFDERVVFRGNMRMDPNTVLDELEKRADKEGISERVRLFLLIDPKESPNESDGLRRPVLVALPAAAVPDQSTAFSLAFSVVVGVAAFATTFSYGVGIFGFTPEVISGIARGNTAEALVTLPVSLGCMAVALLHDFGHRVMGKLRKVELGLPFFIPSLQIGNFGIITPLKSYARLRQDLFDVAVAGPIVGCTASLTALIGGLVATAMTPEAASWFPQIPYALLHASILVGTIADTILPAAVREQATLAVHPLTMVGYTGLVVNALNLMPIGRLDGGRMVQALYGRVVAGRATAITLLVQAFGSLVGNSPLLLFWGLVCVFLQRESDYPCRNEVLEPDSTRTAIGLSMLFLMVLVLVPFPDQVTDILSSL